MFCNVSEHKKTITATTKYLNLTKTKTWTRQRQRDEKTKTKSITAPRSRRKRTFEITQVVADVILEQKKDVWVDKYV